MRLAFLLATAAGLLAATGANAQSGNYDMGRASSALNVLQAPSGENGDWANSPVGEARLQALAACAVEKDGRKVRHAVEGGLLADPSFLFANCTVRPGEIAAGGRFTRWALIEQLYLASEGTLPAPAAPATGSARNSTALGACVARRDPAASDAFVRSPRRSPAEAAAFKRIVPAINTCAGKARLDLGGAEMHGVLAEALYRMRGPAARGTN